MKRESKSSNYAQSERELAHGISKMAWLGRDGRNEPVLLDVPRNVVETLLREVRAT